MGKLLAAVAGRKTYILATLAALTALVNFLAAGHFGLQDWVSFVHTEAISGAFATVRMAIGHKPV